MSKTYAIFAHIPTSQRPMGNDNPFKMVGHTTAATTGQALLDAQYIYGQAAAVQEVDAKGQLVYPESDE